MREVAERIIREKPGTDEAQLALAFLEMQAAIIKTQEDVNWMLNNRQFLNPGVFEHLEKFSS